MCIPALLRYTRDPFELLFLDIGSLDGTAEYLAGVTAGARDVRIEVIRSATDLGIANAVNDALKLARGQFLVLLNNDTIVVEGWIQQLTGLATMAPEIGLVGPMSNYAAPPQLVEAVPYRIGPKKSGSRSANDPLVDTVAVNEFAKRIREEHRGKWMAVDRLGGFCLLAKREVLKKIEATSSLKEWSDLKLFDTDILSSKARQAGYTLACCRDLYIHHFGSRVFAHGAPDEDGKPKWQEVRNS